MNTTFLRIFKITSVLLIFVALLGNSGCLVDTGSDLTEPKAINQKYLHIYKPNEEIRYDVQRGTTGTLIIRWDLPVGDEEVDADPKTPGLERIPGLLKETTILDYEGLDGDIRVVRYITQDTVEGSPTYGSITVHAYNSYLGPIQHNYVHSASSLAANDTLQAQVVIPSPFVLDDNFNPIPGQSGFGVDLHLLPCNTNTNTCEAENQNLQESLSLNQMVKETLDTTLDSFDVLKVPYSGVANYVVGSSEPPVRLDVRTFCGNVDNPSTLFSGNLWFYPSIGIVHYQVQCSSPSDYFFATISSVNFAY